MSHSFTRTCMATAATLTIAASLAGCSSLNVGELARNRASQGAPCEAMAIDESHNADGNTSGMPSAAEQSKIVEECTAQKDQEAREREAHSQAESLREGERLQREGG